MLERPAAADPGFPVIPSRNSDNEGVTGAGLHDRAAPRCVERIQAVAPAACYGFEMNLLSTDVPLVTLRLVLEPLVAAHAAAIFGPLGDERLYRFIPQNPPPSLAQLRARYDRLSSRRSPDGTEAWLNWVMRLSETGEYAGTLEATIFADRTAFIAYTVFVPHQRRGYATEGVARILEHLVADHGVVLMIAEVDTRNAPSRALLERLGFQRVAEHRSADHFKGAPSDEYRYELRPSVRPGASAYRSSTPDGHGV